MIAAPRRVKVVGVNSESIGLGDGKFVDGTAVDIRMWFDRFGLESSARECLGLASA